MFSFSTDTAILLFAHAAAQEVKTKVFSSRHSVPQNEELAQVLLDHTLKVAKSTELSLITVFTDQQQGSTFGERLANAFRDAFAAGYQKVICVGSDCPTLAASDLTLAQEALQDNSLVIGPATDGGAYLIGIRKESFHPEAFSCLNWKTGKVLEELREYAARHSEDPERQAFFLSEKADVDTEQDLIHELDLLPASSQLKGLLQAILTRDSIQHAVQQALTAPLGLPIGSMLLRAPPF